MILNCFMHILHAYERYAMNSQTLVLQNLFIPARETLFSRYTNRCSSFRYVSLVEKYCVKA